MSDDETPRVLRDVMDLMQDIEDCKQVLIVHRDDFEAVQRAVSSNPEMAVGFRVQMSDLPRPGQCYVLPSAVDRRRLTVPDNDSWIEVPWLTK